MRKCRLLVAGWVITQAFAAYGANPVTTDAWDITQGTVILDHSSFDHDAGQGFDARDVFGGMFTTLAAERGNVIFDDTSATGFTDYIEWRTPSPVAIGSFNLFYTSDSPGTVPPRRALGHFALYERASALSPWMQLYTNDVAQDQTQLTASVSAFAATDYRAEFVRAFLNENDYFGPRVIELDGFVAPEPSALLMLGLPSLCLLVRRTKKRGA